MLDEKYELKEVKAYEVILESDTLDGRKDELVGGKLFKSLDDARKAITKRINTPAFYEQMPGSQSQPAKRLGRPKGSKNKPK